MRRPDTIVAARAKDLIRIGNLGGATTSYAHDGIIQYSGILIDQSADNVGGPYARHTRKHEMGHALGFNHVNIRSSVMSTTVGWGYPDITDWDVQAGRIAYQRPPRNQSPDNDPSLFAAPGLALFRHLPSD
jgi:hypothetical protein